MPSQPPETPGDPRPEAAEDAPTQRHRPPAHREPSDAIVIGAITGELSADTRAPIEQVRRNLGGGSRSALGVGFVVVVAVAAAFWLLARPRTRPGEPEGGTAAAPSAPKEPQAVVSPVADPPAAVTVGTVPTAAAPMTAPAPAELPRADKDGRPAPVAQSAVPAPHAPRRRRAAAATEAAAGPAPGEEPARPLPRLPTPAPDDAKE